MIYQLPSRSPRRYRGQYPRRIHSWSYSDSPCQVLIKDILKLKRGAVHIELNDGTRLIADRADLWEVKCGMEFSDCLKQDVEADDLPQERYDFMLYQIRTLREIGER